MLSLGLGGSSISLVFLGVKSNFHGGSRLVDSWNFILGKVIIHWVLTSWNLLGLPNYP